MNERSSLNFLLVHLIRSFDLSCIPVPDDGSNCKLQMEELELDSLRFVGNVNFSRCIDIDSN